MELEPIAFSAAVELTTESIEVASNAVFVDVIDAAAFDVVTPHPEGHNWNSMQSLPFYK